MDVTLHCTGMDWTQKAVPNHTKYSIPVKVKREKGRRSYRDRDIAFQRNLYSWKDIPTSGNGVVLRCGSGMEWSGVEPMQM